MPIHAVIFEDAGFKDLLPLVYWRSVGELRCGTCTLLERIVRYLAPDSISLWLRDELAEVTCERLEQVDLPATVNLASRQQTLFVNARLLLNAPAEPCAVGEVVEAPGGIAMAHLDARTAASLSPAQLLEPGDPSQFLAGHKRADGPSDLIHYPWDLIYAAKDAIQADFQHVGPAKHGRLSAGTTVLGVGGLHLARGAQVMAGVVIDCEQGPVIIETDAVVHPNCTITGPVVIGPECNIQSMSIIRPGACLGPHCKVGGEIGASIFQGFSNKQHSGFLGHSVIGEWCNLGAETVVSNLKNNYSDVRVALNGTSVDSERTFVGLIMGDHSKTGIGSRFTTGAVVGFSSSVAISGITPKFVPSFAWLTDRGAEPHETGKAWYTAQRAVGRRGRSLSQAEEALFRSIHLKASSIERHDLF